MNLVETETVDMELYEMMKVKKILLKSVASKAFSGCFCEASKNKI